MRFPEMQIPEASREQLELFLGYNGNTRVPEGQFADMENLTSDHFPLLAPRKSRGTVAGTEHPTGLIAKDSLCWTDGSRFVMNGYSVEMNLDDRPKQLVSMGAYVVIFPDKKYINTACLTEFGNLEAEFTSRGEVVYTPCGPDGAERIPDYVQTEPPVEPEGGCLWLDTSGSTGVLMEWSSGAAMWNPVAESYVKIQCSGIGADFGQYDGVLLEQLPEAVKALEGNTVVWERGEDFLLVPGLLEEEVRDTASITVSRRVPDMDYVIECGNRLWGCRYGIGADGRAVNALYASKLGDFRNWNCFMGLSTDSYGVSLGADGCFTGAAAHLGYPLFFRENGMHKVYGNLPSNFRVQTTACRGVQKGCENSLAIVGETLFYQSGSGICAYNGALPEEVSQDLGLGPWHGGAAGALGNKYYISMADAGGEYHLFVYDMARKLWHREDNTHADTFCACRGQLYYLENGVIRSVSGGSEPVAWMAETGDLGVSDPDCKYLCRLHLRMQLEKGSRVTVKVCYDGGRWETAGTLRGTGLGSFCLPIAVRRCTHLRLRLEGLGEARVYAITKTMERGSDWL